MNKVLGSSSWFSSNILGQRTDRIQHWLELFQISCMREHLQQSMLSRSFDKIKSLLKNEIDAKDFVQDVISYLLNLSKVQRYYRRKIFPIIEVICSLMGDNDYSAYEGFLYRYSALFRRKRRKNITPENVSQFSLSMSSENIYYLAWYKKSIIGRVGVIFRCAIDNKEFWEISGLTVLKNFQG